MYRLLPRIKNFYILKNFAALRLCARILLIGMDWIGSMVLSCQRCRGVKIASRNGAKTQRKMELMVYWYVLDPQHLTGLVILGEKHLLFRPRRHSPQLHPALERPQQPRLDPAGLALRQMIPIGVG